MLIVGRAAYTAAEFHMFLQRRSDAGREALERYIDSNATWSREAYVASLEALERLRPDRALFRHDHSAWSRSESGTSLKS